MKKTPEIKDYSALINLAQNDRPTGVPSDFVRVDLWGKQFGKSRTFPRY
jgi:hypothetical protein